MPIDPSEKLVYSKGPDGRYWWLSGIRVPNEERPRNILWPCPDEHGSVLVVTLDLQDLKLYARFERLDPKTEADLVCW